MADYNVASSRKPDVKKVYCSIAELNPSEEREKLCKKCKFIFML